MNDGFEYSNTKGFIGSACNSRCYNKVELHGHLWELGVGYYPAHGYIVGTGSPIYNDSNYNGHASVICLTKIDETLSSPGVSVYYRVYPVPDSLHNIPDAYTGIVNYTYNISPLWVLPKPSKNVLYFYAVVGGVLYLFTFDVLSNSYTQAVVSYSPINGLWSRPFGSPNNTQHGNIAIQPSQIPLPLAIPICAPGADQTGCDVAIPIARRDNITSPQTCQFGIKAKGPFGEKPGFLYTYRPDLHPGYPREFFANVSGYTEINGCLILRNPQKVSTKPGDLQNISIVDGGSYDQRDEFAIPDVPTDIYTMYGGNTQTVTPSCQLISPYSNDTFILSGDGQFGAQAVSYRYYENPYYDPNGYGSTPLLNSGLFCQAVIIDFSMLPPSLTTSPPALAYVLNTTSAYNGNPWNAVDYGQAIWQSTNNNVTMTDSGLRYPNGDPILLPVNDNRRFESGMVKGVLASPSHIRGCKITSLTTPGGGCSAIEPGWCDGRRMTFADDLGNTITYGFFSMDFNGFSHIGTVYFSVLTDANNVDIKLFYQGYTNSSNVWVSYSGTSTTRDFYYNSQIWNQLFYPSTTGVIVVAGVSLYGNSFFYDSTNRIFSQTHPIFCLSLGDVSSSDLKYVIETKNYFFALHSNNRYIAMMTKGPTTWLRNIYTPSQRASNITPLFLAYLENWN